MNKFSINSTPIIVGDHAVSEIHNFLKKEVFTHIFMFFCNALDNISLLIDNLSQLSLYINGFSQNIYFIFFSIA